MLRVEIRWIDSGASYENGWETKDKIIKSASLSEIQTVGFLMHEDKDTYYVALSRDPLNGHFYGVQLIAKTAVTSVTRLRARGGSATEEDDQG